MLFTPDNMDDISRYYKNTFVKFKETGDVLFYIRQVHDNRVDGTTTDGTPFELYLSEDHPYEVDYVLPHKAFFSWGDHACQLQRIPAKQYQRGLSSNNTAIAGLRSSGASFDIGLEFSILNAFVSKQAYVSLDGAVESDKISVPLSPRFAFVPHTKKIYADFLCVGQLTPKRKNVKVFHDLFRPELMRLAQDTHYKVV